MLKKRRVSLSQLKVFKLNTGTIIRATVKPLSVGVSNAGSWEHMRTNESETNEKLYLFAIKSRAIAGHDTNAKTRAHRNVGYGVMCH
ncbi:hypothetical protein TNCV_4481841 [Trichonephila clavipes]|nr:hypothetical protein TNCV_4481841 [Trichonephila clavipes]